jgi:hypothetical protein
MENKEPFEIPQNATDDAPQNRMPHAVKPSKQLRLQHNLKKDTWVTIAGYALVLFLMAGGFAAVFLVHENELYKL